jgi:hypothetical protein
MTWTLREAVASGKIKAARSETVATDLRYQRFAGYMKPISTSARTRTKNVGGARSSTEAKHVRQRGEADMSTWQMKCVDTGNWKPSPQNHVYAGFGAVFWVYCKKFCGPANFQLDTAKR